VPLVAVNRESDDKAFSSLSIDGYGGGRQAVDHLVALGHRRIAYCGNSQLRHIAVRQQGIKDAMESHGLMPVYAGSLQVRQSDKEFRDGCVQVLKSGATAAILCDWAGARCLDILTSLDAQVPQQLSLIDFDDMELHTASGLRVSSVGYDKDWMGRAAGRMLVQLMEEQRNVRQFSMTVRTHIVEHDTTSLATNDFK
jgi:DNA-binding LacI/PurR family transcriptional regulator